MNPDPPRGGSASDGATEPFVAPVPGLDAVTPAADPWAKANLGYSRDRWLLIPMVLWPVGVLQRDAEALAIALGVWLLTYPLYGAWSLWRIKDADPKTDLWRPIALLVLGALPFLGFIPLAFAFSKPVFAALILVSYVAGVAALSTARYGWPRRRLGHLMAAGALAAFLLAIAAGAGAVLIAVAASRSRPVAFDFIFGGAGLALALVMGWLAIGLARAARRAPA